MFSSNYPQLQKRIYTDLFHKFTIADAQAGWCFVQFFFSMKVVNSIFRLYLLEIKIYLGKVINPLT